MKYDVVIVGGGVAGSLLAKQLSWAGKHVLLLEAGLNLAGTWDGYDSYLQNFYTQWLKTDQAPYGFNPNARFPQSLTQNDGKPSTEDEYIVSKGMTYPGSYVRQLGGTSLHWTGTMLRLMPNDFRMATLYGQGRDWPISYDDLNPYFNRAEWEIGVSGDVADQSIGGIHFDQGYQYPMQRIPVSYMDQRVGKVLDGMTVEECGQEFTLSVRSLPQARNSTPNDGYRPAGAVGRPDYGQRCEGHANCVPICPVQAKYNSLKTLTAAKKENLEVSTQSVASKINIDAASGRVTGIQYKAYKDTKSAEHTVEVAEGTIYVISAHVFETAKLLLASQAANSSGQVGRNLMSHPTLLAWGTMPENVGAFRGPIVTSGMESMRDGEFRKYRAAWRCDLSNGGWAYPTGAPVTTVQQLVDSENAFGKGLRDQLASTQPRQISLQFLTEQLPESTNRITIDQTQVDQLGNYLPILHYGLSDYTKAGIAAARRLSKRIFARMGVADASTYSAAYAQLTDQGYFEYEGEGFGYWAAGHYAGSHRMGSSRADSVVNPRQQTWDHENLYLVGAGNFCTLGTPNPTLTLSALALWAADNIIKDLG